MTAIWVEKLLTKVVKRTVDLAQGWPCMNTYSSFEILFLFWLNSPRICFFQKAYEFGDLSILGIPIVPENQRIGGNMVIGWKKDY